MSHWMNRTRLGLAALSIASLMMLGCEDGGTNANPNAAVDIRLSCAVRLAFEGKETEAFLAKPSMSFVEAHFWFPDTLADDVMFGVDQEFMEGKSDFSSFEGADWMGLVALTRTGRLGVVVGTRDSHAGEPDDANNWELIELGVKLKPNTWYKIRTEANFEKKRFASFTLQGPGVDKTVDLSHLRLSYPNYMPFVNRTLAYYPFSLRVAEQAGPGTSEVFIDDMRAGIRSNGKWVEILNEDFEASSPIIDLPIGLTELVVGIPLEKMGQDRWYKENEGALVSYSKLQARSGSRSLKADARTSALRVSADASSEAN